MSEKVTRGAGSTRRTDFDRLQGTWHVRSLEADGQKLPAGTFDGSTIVIKGKTFRSVGMGATYEGTVELDQTKNPKTFHLLFTAGHAAGTRHLGIYTLTGDRWTICLATRGSKRPERFATRPGTGFALETLERGDVVRTARTAKAEPAAAGGRSTPGAVADRHAAQSGAATAWEGEWAMVAAVFNGVAMGQDMVKWCQRITHGDVTSVVAGPQVMLKARFTLDDSKTPPAVDYVNLAGTHKGKAQAGIFELSRDRLSICMAAPGQPRPGGFSSEAGDGRSYTTWRKVGG
jgi:uncharacterized protein (TIGR03067 family)